MPGKLVLRDGFVTGVGEVVLRHPLPLLTREVRPLEIEPRSARFLLQDVHAPFADPDNGQLALEAKRKVVSREFDEYFDTLQLVSANIEHLIAAARDHGLEIIFSCLGHEPGASPSVFQEATGWRWDLSGPNGAFPERWQPRDGDRVFTKPGWGALGNPAFASFLEERQTQAIVIVGTMFDFGIRQTSYELADRGISTLIISDAVVPLTLAAQNHTSGNVAHGLTKLRSTAELLDLLDVMGREGSVTI